MTPGTLIDSVLLANGRVALNKVGKKLELLEINRTFNKNENVPFNANSITAKFWQYGAKTDTSIVYH